MDWLITGYKLVNRGVGGMIVRQPDLPGRATDALPYGRQREGVLPARAARLLLGEAIAAVDGPVLAGFEGDLAR